MTQFIDRRVDTIRQRNKNAVNRRLFIRRFKKQIKRAVSDAIGKRSITDIDSGEKVIIPGKDLSEPVFQHKPGGKKETVYPENHDFVKGDKIKRPSTNDNGKGSNASNTGEGLDEFGFELSRDEFLNLFFEDLELPDLVRKRIGKITTKQYIKAGYTNEGLPSNISVIQSLRNALGRRIALSASHKKTLRQKEIDLDEALLELSPDHPQISALKIEIDTLTKRIKAIPFIDPFDLKYHNRVKQEKPTTQAVMFCLMDVSGSMDKTKKAIAKRFFILLYLFLNKNYEKIELVFIRHHTSAKQVGEDEFFYSRETGGTVVSSALELMAEIMTKQYPSGEWNIYAAQASDGDNWNADSPRCQEILFNRIIPYIQYFAYTEIMPRHHQSLWHAYQQIQETSVNFSMQQINDLSDIYPVFRSLFKRQVNHVS